MPRWSGNAASGQSGFISLAQNSATGKWIPTTCEGSGHLKTSDSGFMTAFGERAAAVKVPEGQFSFPMHLDSSVWDMTSVSTGTCYTANSQLVVSTGTGSTGSATVLSHDLMHYRSGQGLLFQCSAVFTTGVADSSQGIGIGDTNNGFFIGYSGATFGVFHFNGGSSTFIPQSGWSGDDKLDGNGATGVDLDPTLPNVYFIQAQLHFMGKINFYAVVNPCAPPHLVHTIQWPNTDHSGQNTTIDYGNLPVRVFATNSGNGADVVVKTASIAVFIEGEMRNLGHNHAAFVEAVNVSSEKAIITIQNKNEVLGNTNHNDVILNFIAVASDNATAPAVFRMYIDANVDIDGVVNNFVYTDVDAVSSSVEVSESKGTVQAVLTGTATSGSATTILIPATGGDEDANNYLVGRNIAITGGTGIGQTRTITGHAYDVATGNTLTVARWEDSKTPDDTTEFTIINGRVPKILVCGQNSSQIITFTDGGAIHLPPGSRLTATLQCNDTTNRMMCALGWGEIQ